MRRALKIICLIMLVGSGINLIAGLISLFVSFGTDGGVVLGGGMELDAAVAAASSALLSLLGSLAGIIVSCLGIRGSDDPSKIRAFKIVAIIGAAVATVSLFSGLLDGISAPPNAASVLIALLMVVLSAMAAEIQRESLGIRMRSMKDVSDDGDSHNA